MNLARGCMVNIDVEGLQEKIREIIESTGLRLYDVSFNKVSRTLRVFVDKEAGNVMIKDCEMISGLISQELVHLDIIDFSYTLEVSSPGIERPLHRPEHYAWAQGKCVEITLNDRKVKGHVRAVTQDTVIIASGTAEATISFCDIVKARVVQES